MKTQSITIDNLAEVLKLNGWEFSEENRWNFSFRKGDKIIYWDIDKI